MVAIQLCCDQCRARNGEVGSGLADAEEIYHYICVLCYAAYVSVCFWGVMMVGSGHGM